MRQESTVHIGSREVRVVSEVLVDPELLIVNTILSMEDDVLKRHHVTVPAAVARDYEAQGTSALHACLHTSHLRLVQSLLTTSAERKPTSPSATSHGGVSAGVLATLVLDEHGEVISRAGEEQVPGSWLRAAYLLPGLCEMAGERLGLGAMRRVVAAGDRVSAVVHRGPRQTRIRFVDPAELGGRSGSVDTGTLAPSAHEEAV